MPGFSIHGGHWVQNGTDVTIASEDASGVTVQAGGSADTKPSSWTEIVASAPIGVPQVLLYSADQLGPDSFLVDFAIGAVSAETTLVENVLYQSSQNYNDLAAAIFPLPAVAGGQRISARAQASEANRTVEIDILAALPPLGAASALGRCTTYGANTGDSGGTPVDPGTTVNTKPSGWTEIVASTTRPIRLLNVCIGNQEVSFRQPTNFYLELAIGAASSEEVVVPDLLMQGNILETITPPNYLVDVQIPVGSRISARAQCDKSQAYRLFDVALVGYS